VRLLPVSVILLVIPCLSRASTLDDMELRSNVETAIRGTAQTASLHLKIRVEDAVAIPEGLVHDLNQADDVMTLAAKVKGIRRVDRSQLRLEFPATLDDQVAARVERSLFEIPKYASSTIKVAVGGGVVTLTGGIKNAAWRAEIRRICGAIDGVADLVDELVTPDTPDEKIQKVLDGVFGIRATPRFPGRVSAIVTTGVVALEGHVPRLHDKLVAERAAFGINGVHRVDNGLTLESGTAIRVIHP
jgi:osmotically-inducible protein OsmY